MKKLIIILSIIGVLGAGGAAAGTVAYVNSQPDIVAAQALSGLAEDFLKRDELDMLSSVADGGSFEFNIDEAENDEESSQPIYASGKMYFDDEAFMLEDLKLNQNGIDVISLDLYVSEKVGYIKGDKILDGAYGVKIEDAADELKESIFAPDSQSKYAMEQTDFDELLLGLDSYDIKGYKADMERLTDYCLEELWDITREHLDFKQKNVDEIAIGEDKTSARVVYVEFEYDDIRSILNKFVIFIEEDDKVEEFVEKYYGKDAEAKFDEILTVINEYRADIQNKVDGIIGRNIKTVLSIYTKKLSTEAIMVTLELDDAYETSYSLEVGKDGIKNTDRIYLKLAEKTYLYEIEYDNSKEYRASLTIDGEPILEIKTNRKEKTFELTVNDYSDGERTGTNTLYGSYKKGLGRLEIRFEKSVYDVRFSQNDTENAVNITLIFDSNDKMPEPIDDFYSLSDITEEDIDNVIENLSDVLSEILQ